MLRKISFILMSVCGAGLVKADDIYVFSAPQGIVRHFDSGGNLLNTLPPAGTGNAFQGALDAGSNLYVANGGLNQIHKFSPSDADLGVFAASGMSLAADVAVDG